MRLRQIALAFPIAIAMLLAHASPAVACGILVSRSGLVEADTFTAMIAHDGGDREDVAVRITYGNVGEDFGWVMPVPSLPTLAAADLSGFAAAARITAPPARPRGGTGFGVGAGAPPPGSVEEVSRSVIGDLEFVVLRATGSGALSGWMATNGFAFHYGQAEALERYIERGWLVIAARLAQQAATVRKAASVRVSFASPTLVYPLAAASATHPGSLRTTFFAITPWRPSAEGLPETVVRPRPDGSFAEPGPRLELRYSKPLEASDAASLSRTIPARAGGWLTRYDSSWDLRALERDLTLVRAADQSVIDFSAIEALDDEGGPPALGIAALGWALLTAALFVGRRAARGRTLGRIFLAMGIVSALLPVVAALLVLALSP